MTTTEPTSDSMEPQGNPGDGGSRLTLRAIIGDLASRFFSLESGWLRTVKELTTGPGPMIRRYIEGPRKVYANPFAYLLVATAISVVVQSTVGFQEWMLAGTLNNPDMSPKVAAFCVRWWGTTKRSTASAGRRTASV